MRFYRASCQKGRQRLFSQYFLRTIKNNFIHPLITIESIKSTRTYFNPKIMNAATPQIG